MKVLGFDTSNYTTSVAWYDGEQWDNQSKLLPVKEGELGLRQSDALFNHVIGLPELTDRLFFNVDPSEIRAVGVSTRPRAVEGSYMPCFLAGIGHAKTIAQLLHVPLIEVSHQQGHLAAVLRSAQCMELRKEPFLAWHLSGGTTELLLVEPMGSNLNCTILGGTTDISAGQLIDRTGQLLKLPFPAGKTLDELSKAAQNKDYFRVKCPDTYFSLSGVQNKVQEYLSNTCSQEETAGYALRCVCRAVEKATKNALDRFPGLPVVFSGGVASNSMLRKIMEPYDCVFCPPQYATDNALGVAVLAWHILEEQNAAGDFISQRS